MRQIWALLPPKCGVRNRSELESEAVRQANPSRAGTTSPLQLRLQRTTTMNSLKTLLRASRIATAAITAGGLAATAFAAPATTFTAGAFNLLGTPNDGMVCRV